MPCGRLDGGGGGGGGVMNRTVRWVVVGEASLVWVDSEPDGDTGGDDGGGCGKWCCRPCRSASAWRWSMPCICADRTSPEGHPVLRSTSISSFSSRCRRIDWALNMRAATQPAAKKAQSRGGSPNCIPVFGPRGKLVMIAGGDLTRVSWVGAFWEVRECNDDRRCDETESCRRESVLLQCRCAS